MRHMHPISRAQLPVLTGNGIYGLLQDGIILGLTAIFSSWDNFASVIRNLETFYQKI